MNPFAIWPLYCVTKSYLTTAAHTNKSFIRQVRKNPCCTLIKPLALAIFTSIYTIKDVQAEPCTKVSNSTSETSDISMLNHLRKTIFCMRFFLCARRKKGEKNGAKQMPEQAEFKPLSIQLYRLTLVSGLSLGFYLQSKCLASPIIFYINQEKVVPFKYDYTKSAPSQKHSLPKKCVCL